MTEPTVSSADATNFPEPGGTKLTHLNAKARLTDTNYPVLLLNGYTYWPLSYIDNRISFAIVVTNTTKHVTESNILSIIEAPGSRYIDRIQVNTTKHEVNFVGEGSEIATLSFDALSALPGYTAVTSADATNFPVPGGTKLTSDPEDGSTDTNYPVLLLKGYTYWPLSYIDNRLSFAIVVTNTTDNVTESNIVSIIEAPGARYIRNVNDDNLKHKVNFFGQSGVATLSFKALSTFPGYATVTTADATSFPAPNGTKVTSDPEAGLTETLYPVLLLKGYTYWPLSYIDNRLSFAIVVTNTTDNVTESNIISIIEAPGARYIRHIQEDNLKHKVSFGGQSSDTTLSFNALSISPGSTSKYS